MPTSTSDKPPIITTSNSTSFLPKRSTSKTKSTRPSHHANNSATSFVNPWPSAQLPTWTEMLSGPFPVGFYQPHHHINSRSRSVKVVSPDWGQHALKKRKVSKSDYVVGTWLGHASALVEVPGSSFSTPPPSATTSSISDPDVNQRVSQDGRSTYLLFDPIFSHRAGPTAYSGPSRIHPPPCQIQDLPGCDAVLISHNHYDHLDTASIRAVMKAFPDAWYFVPLGIRSWLLATGVRSDRVVELDWWEDRDMHWSKTGGDDTGSVDSRQQVFEMITETSSLQQTKSQTTFKISCVPAQHNSGRTPGDQAGTLWCGWIVERFEHDPGSPQSGEIQQPSESGSSHPPQRKTTIYHAGDTGYRVLPHLPATCPAFQAIGEKFGPIDLSFIPIWRGGTLGFFSALGLRLSHHDVPATLHASPADAVDIHCDVKSRFSVGVHFGTFVGAEVETLEAVQEFREKCDERGLQWLDDEDNRGQVEVEPEARKEDYDMGKAGVINIGESVVVELF